MPLYPDSFRAQFVRHWLSPWDVDTQPIELLIDSPALLASGWLERLKGPVLVLTDNTCPHYLNWLCQAGWSVLVSPRSAAEVVQAAQCVMSGGTVYRGPDLHAVSRLFPRERSVLYAIAVGLDNAEVAAWLGISVKTVANVASELLDKLGLKNRVEAALYFRGEHVRGEHCRGERTGAASYPPPPASVRPRYASTRATRELAPSLS